MKANLFTTRMKIIAWLCLSVAFAPMDSFAQNGPVTSRLHRVLVYFYNFGASDHANTPAYAAYFRTLGTTYGFTADTTRSQSVFTTANLANYDVIVLFSAYYFGQNMSAAQKSAVQTWYSSNHGMACFHQCVRNNWGGTYPNWYDSLMGVQYNTYAGFASGPMYVDSQAVGTDLAWSSSGTQYTATSTQNWDDEWYSYLATPKGLPNTKMIWYTKRSAFSGFNFTLTGDYQPMAWAREVQGGRFVLSSSFHRDAPRTSTVTSLRQFIDGHFVGSLKYLAGYTGCTDPTSTNYNPKATVNDPAVCTGGTSGIRIADNAYIGAAIANLKVNITDPGAHSLEVFNAKGARAVMYKGTGAKEYDFQKILEPGVYYVKVKTGSGSASKKIFLL
jgi:hypothetical protein